MAGARNHADRIFGLPPARTPSHRQQQELLVGVHQHLREELDQIRSAVDQVLAGELAAGPARSAINAMTMRQNYWAIGAFCATYCRVVTTHHTIEDVAWFPALSQESEAMGETITALHAEHEVIAGLLVGLDDALVAVVADRGTRASAALDAARRAVEELSSALLAHLDREEDALLGPLGEVLVEG